VEGVIVDAAGKPVAEADVWWTPKSGIGSIAQSDASGRFRFDSLPAGEGTVTVSSDGTGLAPKEVHDVHVGGPALRIVLGKCPRVFGRIVGLTPGEKTGIGLLSLGFTGGVGDARAPKDGRIEAALYEVDVPALLVIKREGKPLTIVEAPALPAGARHDLGDIALDPGRTLEGVVLDEKGVPRAGARASIGDRWGEFVTREVETGSDGSFRFPMLPTRSVELRVDLAEHPVHIETVPASVKEPVRVVVDLGGGLSIRVVDAAGAPVPQATVVFMPDGEHPYDHDFDGTARLRDADAMGRLEVRLQARGHRIRAFDDAGRRANVPSVVVERGPEAKPLEIVLR